MYQYGWFSPNGENVDFGILSKLTFHSLMKEKPLGNKVNKCPSSLREKSSSVLIKTSDNKSTFNNDNKSITNDNKSTLEKQIYLGKAQSTIYILRGDCWKNQSQGQSQNQLLASFAKSFTWCRPSSNTLALTDIGAIGVELLH